MTICNTEFTRDPLRFLQTHAFSCNYGAQDGVVGRYVFESDRDFGMVLRNAGNGEGDVVRAYFLRYADNSSFSLKLGNDADYMLTPVLTGCTFVVNDKWFSPTVSHLNIQNQQGTIDQPMIDQSITQMYGNQRGVITANYYTVKKADYVGANDAPLESRLLVIGVRGFSGWTFYRVKHRLVGLGEWQVSEGPTRIN